MLAYVCVRGRKRMMTKTMNFVCFKNIILFFSIFIKVMFKIFSPSTIANIKMLSAQRLSFVYIDGANEKAKWWNLTSFMLQIHGPNIWRHARKHLKNTINEFLYEYILLPSCKQPSISICFITPLSSFPTCKKWK